MISKWTVLKVLISGDIHRAFSLIRSLAFRGPTPWASLGCEGDICVPRILKILSFSVLMNGLQKRHFAPHLETFLRTPMSNTVIAVLGRDLPSVIIKVHIHPPRRVYLVMTFGIQSVNTVSVEARRPPMTRIPE